MPNKLEKALRTQNKSKQNKQVELSGSMGVTINGVQTVEVPNRSGFVYVLLNTKEQELIQAFNDKVSGVYGLAVIVVWKVNRYEVLRKDDIRYGTWNSSYLPKHGNQHSFNPDDGGGGDVSFIYGKQFVPLSLTPSGTFGAPVAIIAGYAQQEAGWHYIPNTTTPNITNHKPTDDQARMVLVAIDWQTRTPQLIIGTGTFAATLTGTADVIPYLPSTTGVYQVPIAGVRLVSGTTAVTWQNIYDVRQYFHPSLSGSAGGGGGGGSSIDTIGVAGLDDGIPLGTGTAINWVGAGVTATRSGTVFNVNIPGGSSVDTIGIGAMDDGISIGTGSIVDFGDNITATRSGTVIRVDVSSVAPIQTDGFLVQDEGVLLGTGTVLNFVGAGVTATLGGTVFNVDIPGGGGGGGTEIVGQHLGNSVGTGTVLNVIGGLTISGSTLRLEATRTLSEYVNLTVTNLPAADAVLPSIGLQIPTFLDSLVGVTQARLFASFGNTSPFSTGTIVHAKYSTDTLVWNELAMFPDTQGRLYWFSGSVRKTEWFPINTNAAIEDCWLRFYTTGGNGAADPTVASLGIQFR